MDAVNPVAPVVPLQGLVPSGSQRLTAREIVYETLRRAILTGALAGGTHLVQSEIAQRLEVSTTPVREAMRDLATEALIEFDAHRGAVVRSVQLDEAREVYQLRQLLEPVAIRRAVANASPEQIAKAEALHEKIGGESDAGRWIELNHAFHTVLLESGTSHVLATVLRFLHDCAALYVGAAVSGRPEVQQRAHTEHAEMLEAFRAGDGDEAARIVGIHLEATMAALDTAQGAP